MAAFASNAGIVAGLTSQGTNKARPTVFYLDSELYMYNGGTPNGWKWNTGTSQWDSNTFIEAFDVDPGINKRPCAFYYNSELYMLLGGTGVPLGYKWSSANSQWEQNADISSGISVISSQIAPTVFFIGSTMYLILGNFDGTYQGFYWDGAQWVEDNNVITGLVDSGASIMPTTFYYDSVLYLVSNREYCFSWNTLSSTWESSSIGGSIPVSAGIAKPAAFEYESLIYIISGTSAFTGHILQSTAKIIDVTAESGVNIKAKLTVNLSEALETGDVLTAYNAPDAAGLGNSLYLVELTQLDSVTWEYQTDISEATWCYFRGVQTWNEIQIDTDDFNERYFILPTMSPTVINITDVNNYRILNSPTHNWNHGLLFYNDFIYGSARNFPDLGNADIFKIEAADYSNLIQETIYLNKTAQTSRLYDYDQIVVHKGFLWVQSGQYLVRINFSDLDYMIFSGLAVQGHREPPVADSDYIYITAGLAATKIDSSLLIGSFVSYGYDGSSAVAVPPTAILTTCTFIQLHPTELVYCHSAMVDSQYLYSAQTTTASTLSGYDDGLGINMCHVQKIRKSDMVTVNDVVIPRSTDDMVQSSEYIFLAPELPSLGANVLQLGYTWGLFAINKQTFEIKYLKSLTPRQYQNGSLNAAYGVFYFNDKITAQLINSKSTIIIDVSEIEQWGDNYPIGGATDAIYTFQLNGVDLTVPCNELVLDNAGWVHTNTWEDPTMIFKFGLSEITDVDKEPILETILISSDCGGATVIGYYVVDEGESELTAGGFNYGTDPLDLSINVPVDPFSYEFETTLEGLTAGIYYIQAYGVNTEGTFYGNVVMFSTYNVLKLSYDTILAEYDCISKLNGCSIRCVQDAPGEIDGTIGIVTDIDGNVYTTIVINEKRWFVQNLRTTKYKDGTEIPYVTGATEWSEQEDGARVAYDNDLDNINCPTTTTTSTTDYPITTTSTTTEVPVTTTTTTIPPTTTTTTTEEPPVTTTTSTTEELITTTTTSTTEEITTTTTTTNGIDGESLTTDTTMVTADSSLTITVDTIESTIREEFDALNTKFTTLYNLI